MIRFTWYLVLDIPQDLFGDWKNTFAEDQLWKAASNN